MLGGSGQGEQIAANKVHGVRAALCHDLYLARLSRAHNDANVLAMGARVIARDLREGDRRGCGSPRRSTAGATCRGSSRSRPIERGELYDARVRGRLGGPEGDGPRGGRRRSPASSNGSGRTLRLIASENYASPAVLAAVGSTMNNKYAEGYPGRRYYGGCEFVDVTEQLAIDRAKQLFGAEHANVQPHAGAQANLAVFGAFLEPKDPSEHRCSGWCLPTAVTSRTARR